MVSDHQQQIPPIVLLDANLLYPFHLRNLLIQLGVEDLIDVRWTIAIHEEWISNLVADGRARRERLMRTLAIMNRVLPRAEVRGYEHRIVSLALPDPDDRHVLAAAIEAQASVLLTFNLSDFPPTSLSACGIIARNPDDFLCELLDAEPDMVASAVDRARLNLNVTTPDASEFIEILHRQGLTLFSARLRSRAAA